MFGRTKFFSLNLIRDLQKSQQSLRLFGTRSSRHYVLRGKHHDDDNEDDGRRKRRNKAKREGEENEEEDGHSSIYLHKSRGQHILTNPRVLDAIVRKADIKPTDTVLEIGPGTGNLTLRLLEAAKNVYAVEIDKRMIEILNNRVNERGLQDKITVICKDALKADFPEFDLIVANIPYGISSPLIAKLVFGANTFRSATLLLQKEFAKRLLAKPGDSEYNRLAVNVKLVADVQFIMDVSKRDFVPCPRVDSSVVKIYPKAQVPEVDMEEWWAFTRTCFSKKNKTLGATFKQKKKVIELLTRSQIKDRHKENVVTVNDLNDETHYDDERKEEEEEDGGEEESDVDEDCSSSLCLGTETGLFKDKIVAVLKAGGFEDKRPSKLSNEELLCLLSLFNKSGIYFHDQRKGKPEPNLAFAASYDI